MIYGTCYFISRRSAERYYDNYCYDNVKEAVQNKLDQGEIHIGLPPIKEGQKIILIDNNRRYAIEDI